MSTATKVKERPLTLSSWEVHAILHGQKSQLRRVIAPQPQHLGDDVWRYGDETFFSYQAMWDELFHNTYGTKGTPCGSLYQDYGDRIWVREEWTIIQTKSQEEFNATPDIAWYRVDGERHGVSWQTPESMPRWASRLTLEITDIHVERLQEITPEDCEAEGIRFSPWASKPLPLRQQRLALTQLAYLHQWEEWHGPGAWKLNPWLWVITFRRVEAA